MIRVFRESTAVPGMWGEYDTLTIVGNNEISSNKFEYFAEQLCPFRRFAA
jgi:hypothetical protein